MEKNETKIAFPCSVRATRWHCCEAVAFSEVPRYCYVICRSAAERPIKYTFFFFENGKLGNAFIILLYVNMWRSICMVSDGKK